MSMNPGDRLGPYEIVSRLGSGGMGDVFEGRDVRLSRRVAIKILPPDVAGDETSRARFQREARAISALSHPHICAIHDVGQEKGTDYLVLEYLEGETLAQRLARGPLRIEEVLRLGAELAEALAEAHRHGIVHRDLKPANVMLTRSGVKLLDFGLAARAAVVPLASEDTALRPLTSEGAIVGTFGYMSPEQLEGREADARSDIFALGTVLYEMATGQRAFHGSTTASLIAAVMTADPQPLRELRPEIPPPLERVIRKCLEKDADSRWQSAKDLADELRWLSEGSASAKPPQPRRTSRWALIAVLLLAAAAALAGLSRARAPEAPGSKVVVMMDSTNPERIYSPITRANNETNADDLTNLLRDLDVRLVKENTSAFWNREDQVLKEKPLLITIHRGAFATAESILPDPEQFTHAFRLGEKKVQSFIGYAGLANPATKFIVYSRTWHNIGGSAPWVAEVEHRFPHVRGRIVAIDVTGSPEPSFRDPEMAAKMRQLVIDMLDLDVPVAP